MNYTLQPRFWGKVNRRHWKQCWHWNAALDSSGYGSFWWNGSSVMAHRIALFLKTGIMPEELKACHSCNNPICCNPHHLFWGTHKENMEHMISCGRAAWQK